jgi:hypothetical protein
MAHDFKVGDHVEWNSEAGRVQGTIKKKHISEITFKGYTVHACNGPIENIHAGRPCPNCTGQPGYSRITNAEMKLIMKNVVDSRGSCLRPPLDQDRKTREYESRIQFGERYTATWDEPSMPEKPPCVS